MKIPLFFFSVLLVCFDVFSAESKEIRHKDYDWIAEPVKYKPAAHEEKLPDLFLKDKFSIEYIYNEKGELEEYKLIHKIIYLNDDASIEKFNKIYIPAGSGVSFLKLKARSITAAGKMSVFSEKDIKEGVDEKTETKYRYFAFDGIEKGCRIEYFYLIKIAPSYNGTQVFVQSESQKRDVDFEIVSPTNLLFLSKSYNGLPELLADTNEKEKNVLKLVLDTLESLKEEDYAIYDANLKYFIFKLNSNTANDANDISSYGAVAQSLYKIIMAPAEKGFQKKIKKFVQNMDLADAKDEEGKIRKIEMYIKSNVGIINSEHPALSDLSSILDNKAASREGATKLFAAVFNQAVIDYQLVLTSDRQKLKFDDEFESYNFLSDYLFFFPGINKFLAPYDLISCLGLIPDNFTNNYGLFIKKVQLDNFETAVGKIKFIDPPSYKNTYDNTFVSLDFSDDVSKPKIDLKRELAGYYAQNFQPYYSYITLDDQKKMNESLVKDFIRDTEVEKLDIENKGKEFFGIAPFIVKSTLKSNTLVESAGDKLLLKLGDLIGPQMEMYQKEERRQPVENDYARSYHREISFEIPAGYKITNIDALNMDVHMEEDNDRVIAFTSRYELNGNLVKVIVDEYYKKIFYPVEQFDNYRKVINAAADFNKITLFLKKSS